MTWGLVISCTLLSITVTLSHILFLLDKRDKIKLNHCQFQKVDQHFTHPLCTSKILEIQIFLETINSKLTL